MNQSYVPVSCDLYDTLQARATTRRPIRINIVGADGKTEWVQGVLADIYSRDGVEYLKMDDGRELRLDLIGELEK